MPLPPPSPRLPGPRRRRARIGRRALAGALTIGTAVALSGCSSAPRDGGSTTPTPTPAVSGASSPASGVKTVTITVNGSKVTPAPARVDLARGTTLRLVVTVDHDDELHAHGFDVEKEVTAGQPVTVDLTGGEPGLYEVELHHPELRLLQVLVR